MQVPPSGCGAVGLLYLVNNKLLAFVGIDHLECVFTDERVEEGIEAFPFIC